MEHSMVNSISIGTERNGNTKASCMQENVLHNQISSSPLTASIATQPKNDLMETTNVRQFCGTHAEKLIPIKESHAEDRTLSKTKSNDHMTEKHCILNGSEANEVRKTLFCSFPLEKVQTILSKYTSIKSDGNKTKVLRKVLCLYCERTFANVNLRQKHVERCHSSKQLRRVSLRKNQNFLTNTPCTYCDKFTSTEHTLKDLFKHLIDNHSNNYFGCFSCEMRFLNSAHLKDHNVLCHSVKTPATVHDLTISLSSSSNLEKKEEQELLLKTPLKKQKTRKGSKIIVDATNMEDSTTSTSTKNLRSKKLTVKSSRMILKKSKRLQAKGSGDICRKKQGRDFNEKKRKIRSEHTLHPKLNEKTTSNIVNPYPEFDRFYQPRQITDHSIDNLKINSLTFDDVFDKAFFSRIKCNIQENLLHHIDGKLFKNEESESRISNFEKNSNISLEPQNVNTENYGCEISLNAVAPTTLMLSNPLGDDPESQIEYGSRPSKKKTHVKKDEVHYKYFTRRKYQASILEHKENRDLSKLDMRTQYLIKTRQQKIIDDKRSPKEVLDYFSSEEYKNMAQKEELNRILDRRGPFEDLREEVSKKAALDKLNDKNCNSNNDGHLSEIEELLNDILDRVFELSPKSRFSICTSTKKLSPTLENSVPEIPSYLNLRPSSSLTNENEIDKSDKIALICSSQETENFELPGNTVRGKNEKVELTGEWARSRIYVCAACGMKLQNIKQFLEHKSASHQYIWVQHYEFVGNQSELYTHLSIPVLGKVGVLETTIPCKIWKRSDARLCTKCGKQCNSLGELHRHILECGGDWTWMLARKKCKYRPFGAKSRRKRRGLVKRIYPQKSESTEKKIFKKSFDIPRQKPSDADTIKRMLANLPPKRATRKVISLKDGFSNTRTKHGKKTKQSKLTCGKLIHGIPKEQKTVAKNEYEKTNNENTNYRRSLRSLNKVLTSRILDTNSSLMARRKYTRKIKSKQTKNTTDKSENSVARRLDEVPHRKVTKTNGAKIQNVKEVLGDFKSKRCSPRIGKRLEFSASNDKLNIKRYFSVKKNNIIENTSKIRVNKINSDGQNNKIRNSLQNDQLHKKIVPQTHEIKNGQLSSIRNLRKRKNENNSRKSCIKKKAKMINSSPAKISKLKTCLKSDITSNDSQLNENGAINESNNHIDIFTDDFFDESEKSIETVVNDSDLEKKFATAPPTQLEKQEKSCKFDSEKDLFINTKNENIKFFGLQPSHSEQQKRKVKKATRGLNDCIAMLTSKLSKDLQEHTTNNFFMDEVYSQNKTEEMLDSINEKPESILKVPLSNEHFNLSVKNKDENINISNNFQENSNAVINEKCKQNEKKLHCESPDTSINITALPEIEKGIYNEEKSEFEILNEIGKGSMCNELIVSEVADLSDTECNNTTEKIVHDHEDSTNTELKKDEVFVDLKLTDIKNMENIQSHCDESYGDSDSDDDIPLLSLFREDQSDRDLLPKNSLSKIEHNHTIIISDQMCSQLDKEGDKKINKDGDLEISNYSQNNNALIDDLQISEKISGLDSNEASEVFEMNDSFEYIEKVNSFENCSNKTNVSIEVIQKDSFDEINLTSSNVLVNKDTINTSSDVKTIDNLIPLEEHGINRVLSKLDDLSIFSKHCVDIEEHEDAIVTEPENVVDFIVCQKVKANTSKHKKNSKVTSDLRKHKKTKKKVSNKMLEDVQIKENSKENTDFENVSSNKNFMRNAKTKALESIFDEALLELSENELVPIPPNINSLEVDVLQVDTQISIKKHDNISTFEENRLEQDNPCTSENNHFNNKCDTKNCIEEDPSTISNDGGNEILNHTVDNNEEMQACHQESIPDTFNNKTNFKELRRSSRNSKRITYNETDLIDPLFDDLDSDKTISQIIRETTKDIFRMKRKSRKLLSHKKTKNGQNEKKICGEELFDLLKTSSNETTMVSKPADTFLNTFDGISTDFNDDNFDVFEDILEKSMAVIEENLSQDVITSSVEDILNNHDTVDQNSKTESADQEITNKWLHKKLKKTKHKYKSKLAQNHIDNKLVSVEKTCSSFQKNLINHTESDRVSNLDYDDSEVNSNEVSGGDFYKTTENEKSKCIYCEICDKSFSRIENLTKHKRTLTHISKLSELEAKEAALKTNNYQENMNIAGEMMISSSDSNKAVNLLEMLKSMDEEACKQYSSPFGVKVDNSNLKLADIINDVLNKPILKKDDNNTNNFREIGIQNENGEQPEIRRYKSLGERKSFESETHMLTTMNDTLAKNVDYFESEISNVETGTILEKQITLLENMIENRSSLSYIDELSVSSTLSVNENVNSTNGMSFNTEQTNSVSPCSEQLEKRNNKKTNIKDNFLKPLQYEEMSEDSALKHCDEQKSRKVLNRDEELFLECCSLLKSGSEVSSYSKKSNDLSKDVNHLEMKTTGEPDWLENTCLSLKKSNDFVECYSDSSGIRTPLGDNFTQENSNSCTISSQWEIDNSCNLLKKDDMKLQSNTLTFEEVFNKNDDIFRKEDKEDLELRRVVSPLNVNPDAPNTELNLSAEILQKGRISNVEEIIPYENRDARDTLTIDGKKLLTKGAMKVFEGLKVSIPTEELNIDKILISGSLIKKSNSDNSSLNKCSIEEENINVQKLSRRNSALLSRSNVKLKARHTSKTMNFKKQNSLQVNCKIHDVYDFEETQDNSDIFTRPNFRSFRSKSDKTKKSEKVEGSDDDTQDGTDAVNFDAFSSSASSMSEILPRKTRTQQNVTKKKCMIMGRIFKNALKSKVTDEDIRNIPLMDNTKLVEDFVLSCSAPVLEDEKKTRMTEEEMNAAFDNLISDKRNESKQDVVNTTSSLLHKNSLSKRKHKARSKKRSNACSESSDDEFKLQRYSKKRRRKKSNNTEDHCINLEQELRECIGVASRKSQRKCTSGKQNVLIEYWSSDESLFEAEEIIVNSVQRNSSDNRELVNNSIPNSPTKELATKPHSFTSCETVDEAFDTGFTAKTSTQTVSRRKRVAANPLYHWSSSSEDESHDLIEIRPVRDEIEGDGDRLVQHGWIVGDSPKKLVTMLAQAKGKKCDTDGVKEHGKKKSSTYS